MRYILPFLLIGCGAPRYTVRELETMGYTNVRAIGYVKGSCTDDDDVKAGFTAEKDGRKT